MDDAQEITANYYNEKAHAWSASKTNSFFHEEGFRKFCALLEDGDEVIDIGCAHGIHIPLFLGIGRALRYEGLDISEKMIEIARGRYPQLSFSVGDILSPATLPQKKFDGFWAAAVLMHVPEEQWRDMLTNIQNISKPNAIGYFTLPSARPSAASATDQRYFSIIPEDRLKEMLQGHKWDLLESGGFPNDVQSVWHWYIVRLPA